jgi:hypothetical protein
MTYIKLSLSQGQPIERKYLLASFASRDVSTVPMTSYMFTVVVMVHIENELLMQTANTSGIWRARKSRSL